MELLVEYDIDICALAECDTLDFQILINELKSKGQNWNIIKLYPKGQIRVLAKQSISIIPKKEEKHFSCYRIRLGDITWLFSVVHAVSPLYKDEDARSDSVRNISDEIRKIEEELFSLPESNSIVVGDFNIQPFSKGMSGIFSFNAVMSENKALKIFRELDSQKYYFYYNPMWKAMGDHKLVQGTYYTDNDQQGKSIYWYSFDQILIRPSLISAFLWEEFLLIERTSNCMFIKNNKIDNRNYSDHLPIKFELKKGEQNES